MRCPIVPMSVLSGAPTKEQILSYLCAMHDAGIDDIMLYPRKGCEVAYMTPAWFETIRNLLEGLESLHMGVWLNDDFYFPSGNAGGKVTAHDAYCLKSLTVRGENKGKRNFVSGETKTRYADVLSYDAMAAFLRESHERYYAAFASYFGRVIRGFYTDEPSPVYMCGPDDIPYYSGMEEEYAARFARDFEADLQSESPLFIERCEDLISDRLALAYFRQISDWCRSHGVVLTGHLYEDHRPRCAAICNGDLPKVLPEIMKPGIDEIPTDFESPYFFSLLGCTDYAKGKHGAMAEVFALGPVNMPYSKQICMMNLCASFGIDTFFAAVSHMNVKGNRLVDVFFHHFGPARPDFEGMKELCREAKEAVLAGAEGFEPEVLIRYPVKKYSRTAIGKTDKEPIGDTEFCSLISELTKRQVQWRYIREDDAGEFKLPVVAEKTEGGFTLNGEEKTAEEIACALARPLLVTLPDGTCPDGVFVRKRRSGKLTVCRYMPEPVDLIVNGKLTHLEGYEVIRDSKEPRRVLGELREATADLMYQNENKARMMYCNETTEARLILETPKTITFCVREECKIAVDGEVLQTGDCQSLGVGFDELYRSTEAVTVGAGTHIVTSGPDYKYLPAVILSGDFSVRYESGNICSVILSDRAEKMPFGKTFCDHGAVTFTLTVDLPKETKALEIKGQPLYIKLTLDGREIGTKNHAPFVFELPEEISGSHTLEITEYSSLGSYFGDVNYFNYHQNSIRWRSTKPSEPSVFGMDSILFLHE